MKSKAQKILAMAAMLFLVQSVRATTVMEWTFQTNEHLTVAGGTGITNAFLLTNATVNTGPAVPAFIAQDPAIKSGFLDIQRTAANEGNGLATHSAQGEWRDYFGREAFGTGTVYIVFRPHFSGVNNSGGQAGRLHIFNYADFNSFDSLGLQIESDTAGIGPTLVLGRSTYNQPIATLPNVNWDSNSWYMIGGSWMPGAPITLYLRQLGTNKPAGMFASSSLSLLEPTNAFKFNNQSFFVGRRTAPNSPENANSDIALVRVLDNEYYSHQGWFDTAYESLVIPEPGTFGLVMMAFAGFGLLRRRT